jgi:NAD(P)-dependent dehydrogenase (short-subunit alcohol dehydrogenase family)
MTGRVADKVALVTGAARGQGRSHAVRLAQEGADIIAVDICQGFDNSPAPGSTPEVLAETAEMVKNLDQRVYTAEVDARDFDSLKRAVDTGVEQLAGSTSSSPTPASAPWPTNCTTPTKRCGKR